MPQFIKSASYLFTATCAYGIIHNDHKMEIVSLIGMVVFGLWLDIANKEIKFGA